MIDTDKILKQLDNIELEPQKKEMRTGKSKSWLGESHWVSLPISEKEKLDEAETWCKDQFGKSGSRWSTTIMTRKLKQELWPHMVTVNRPSQSYEIETWLGQTLGAFKDRWNVVYHHNSTDFYFKRGSDATMFALRWS